MIKEKEKQHLKICGYETQKRTKILSNTTSSSTIKTEKQNTVGKEDRRKILLTEYLIK